jgi:hypothetical protein
MFSKLNSSARAALAFVKARPITFLVLLFLGGLFVVPFLFWGWNKARAALPEKARALVPVAEPKVTPPAA